MVTMGITYEGEPCPIPSVDAGNIIEYRWQKPATHRFKDDRR
jgi:hypothetical protein